MSIAKKRVLVTGGTGMLGAHILYELTKTDYIISAVKRKTSDINSCKKIFSFYNKDFNNLFNKINWVEADLTDYHQTEQVVAENDYIINSAAMVSFNPALQQQLITTNNAITANIVNACLVKNTTKLCHVSSIAAIGESKSKALITENDFKEELKKNSAYSISKTKSELEVWRGISEGLNAVIVNPSVILGPGNWNQGSPRIFKMINSGLKFFTTGINGFVDVRDVAKIILKLTESDISGERYILNSENLTYKYLFSKIAKGLQKEVPNIEARNFLLQTARILESIKYKLLKIEPKITKDTINAALNKHSYSNKKITEEINYDFLPIKTSINDFCKIFLNDMRL